MPSFHAPTLSRWSALFTYLDPPIPGDVFLFPSLFPPLAEFSRSLPFPLPLTPPPVFHYPIFFSPPSFCRLLFSAWSLFPRVTTTTDPPPIGPNFHQALECLSPPWWFFFFFPLQGQDPNCRSKRGHTPLHFLVHFTSFLSPLTRLSHPATFLSQPSLLNVWSPFWPPHSPFPLSIGFDGFLELFLHLFPLSDR